MLGAYYTNQDLKLRPVCFRRHLHGVDKRDQGTVRTGNPKPSSLHYLSGDRVAAIGLLALNPFHETSVHATAGTAIPSSTAAS